MSVAQSDGAGRSRASRDGCARLSGVGEVDVAGAHTREMTVNVRPDALMAAANVSIGEVVGALSAQNLAAPVGRLLGLHDERTIRLGGRVADRRRVPHDRRRRRAAAASSASATSPTCTSASRNPARRRRFYGQEAVGIDIKKSKGYSTTAVADARCSRSSTRSDRRCPQGVTLSVVRDSGRRVANSVAERAGGAHRRRRADRADGVPVPELVALDRHHGPRAAGLGHRVVHGRAGVRLHAEHDVAARPVARHRHPDRRCDRRPREHRAARRDGQGPLHGAAHDGTSEIGLAVAATTFSIVVVFVPIAFMGGVAQQWMAPFALTIACSVLVSLFVSFSLDPMLSAYWPDPHVPIERALVASRAGWPGSTTGSTARPIATSA